MCVCVCAGIQRIDHSLLLYSSQFTFVVLFHFYFLQKPIGDTHAHAHTPHSSIFVAFLLLPSGLMIIIHALQKDRGHSNSVGSARSFIRSEVRLVTPCRFIN